jgi:hypothetical protein
VKVATGSKGGSRLYLDDVVRTSGL